jgi:adenine deaminase
MSDQNLESVISHLITVNQACSERGSNIVKDPFMFLSSLALPVIPSLKRTDKGLIMLINFNLLIFG